jgi:2',3'-cyclic-nucleotide 2'-phosphodiesterase/3'-nucleotidase/5'-nucleotidase
MDFLFALLLVSQAPPPSQAPDTTHLVIVATTDVHGRVLGWDYVRDVEAPGGLSRVATILEGLRAQYPGRVVLVDAGDLLQGNPFATFFARQDQRQPQPIVDALNALQYDAAVPGNHDFDFGLPLLRRAGVEATYHYVAANLDQTSGGSLFSATVVLPRAGVKVGVTGFTTPGVMVWDRAQLAGQVRVRRIAEVAPGALARLAQEGADLKVVVIHSGLGGASSYDTTGVGPENDAAALAAVTPRPDLVIVGHTHREIRDTVINGVHFVQPKNWAQSLAVVHVWLVKIGSAWRVTSIRSELVPLGAVPELPRFTRRLDAAHQAARLWAATPIGTAGAGFDARYARVQDGALLDFINEVQRRKAGAQLSAAAAFEVQAGLPNGEVHLRDVAGVYPYENTLRAVRISGQQLREFLEQSARYFQTYQPGVSRIINDSVPGFNFDVVSGVAYNIDLSRPAGQRIRGLAYEGKLVQATDSFTLALNSYRAAGGGGGGYTMLAGARVTYDRGEDVRDLLVDEIRRVHALDGRAYYRPSWQIIPPEAREAARAAFAPTAAPVNRSDSTLLRVLALTDLHGQLESRVWDWSGGRAVGGSAALRPWLDSLARACRCTSVRLDAGDEMQGTPVSNINYGRGVIAAMNALGIDAAAIGNHEFDWSIDTLLARMQDARYKFLSANITDSVRSARPDWALPWTLVTRNGVKIAVIGLTTVTTPTSTAPRNVRGLAFGNGAQAIRRYLPDARAAADFVIVVAHEGDGAILDVARGLDSGAVDLIVAGHTHQRMDTTVNGIPIVQPGSSGRDIALVDFVRVGGTRREVRAQLVTPYADAVKPDVDLAGSLAAQLDAIKSVTGRSVGRLKVPLRREGAEYGLGRLIADAARNIGKADVGMINNGGIRAGLPEGNVTWGDIQMVQPFQNRMVRLTVKGSALLQALEHCVAGPSGDPDCHVSGVEVWYDPDHRVGTRVTRTRLATGKEIDEGSSYTLALPDFMATGGSGYAMFVGAPGQDLNTLDLDLLIGYLGVLRTPVEAPADVRFHRAGR